jgi:hypothetical protein
LKIDETKYRKKENAEIRSVTYYIDDEEGLLIEANGDTVLGLTYGPTAKDQTLRCPGSTAK